jgi:hypothetical protein
MFGEVSLIAIFCDEDPIGVVSKVENDALASPPEWSSCQSGSGISTSSDSPIRSSCKKDVRWP